jgi:hypothetical protein
LNKKKQTKKNAVLTHVCQHKPTSFLFQNYLTTVEPLGYGIGGTKNFSRKKEVNLKAFLIEMAKNFSRKQ